MREFVQATCEQVLRVSDKGVPVGPALSAIFGNIALEKIDIYMQNTLGECYLRYVDDIFLMVPTEKVKQVDLEFQKLVVSEGLELHPERYCQ